MISVNTYLHVTLGDIERGDTSVSDTASKDTTEHAFCVVGVVVGDRPEVPRAMVSNEIGIQQQGRLT